jgi:hypothetical protein
MIMSYKCYCENWKCQIIPKRGHKMDPPTEIAKNIYALCAQSLQKVNVLVAIL